MMSPNGLYTEKKRAPINDGDYYGNTNHFLQVVCLQPFIECLLEFGVPLSSVLALLSTAMGPPAIDPPHRCLVAVQRALLIRNYAKVDIYNAKHAQLYHSMLQRHLRPAFVRLIVFNPFDDEVVYQQGVPPGIDAIWFRLDNQQLIAEVLCRAHQQVKAVELEDCGLDANIFDALSEAHVQHVTVQGGKIETDYMSQVPQSLTSMTLGTCTSTGLVDLAALYNLRQLTIHYNPIYTGLRGEQMMHDLRLLHSVRRLTLTGALQRQRPHWPLTLLPPQLTHLELNGDFDDTVHSLTLPETLTDLRFGPKFKQPLRRLQLPASLRRLLLHVNYPFECQHLPVDCQLLRYAEIVTDVPHSAHDRSLIPLQTTVADLLLSVEQR